MSYLFGIPILTLLVALQSSLVSHLRLLEGRPDLVLLAVVAWALTGRGQEAMVLGFIGGLLLDAFSQVPLGWSAAVMVLIAAMVSYSEGQFWGANPLMQLAAVLAATVVFHLAGILVLLLLGRQLDLALAVSRVVLPSAFLNLLLALPSAQLAEALRSALFPPPVTG